MIDAGESREQPAAEVTSCLLGKTNTRGEWNKAERTCSRGSDRGGGDSEGGVGGDGVVSGRIVVGNMEVLEP